MNKKEHNFQMVNDEGITDTTKLKFDDFILDLHSLIDQLYNLRSASGCLMHWTEMYA